MVSPAMRTSARRSGAPVPSAISAPRMVQLGDAQFRDQVRGDAIDDLPGSACARFASAMIVMSSPR